VPDATGHVVMPTLSSTGSGSGDMRRHQSPSLPGAESDAVELDLSLVHRGTRSTGYRQWPWAHLGRGSEPAGGANTFSPTAALMIFVLDSFEVVVRFHQRACGGI
jgi:hypothetical protein